MKPIITKWSNPTNGVEIIDTKWSNLANGVKIIENETWEIWKKYIYIGKNVIAKPESLLPYFSFLPQKEKNLPFSSPSCSQLLPEILQSPFAPKSPPPFFLFFLFFPVGSYLPGQAITCFPVSAVSSMASFISSMASLAAGPTHGEGSPPFPPSRVLPAPLIYIKKTKYPLALQRGSTHVTNIRILTSL